MIAGDVYLDTNVYIDWADGERLDLLDALRRSSDVRVCSSVSTAFELLEDFWQATDPKQSRTALLLLSELGLEHVLPSQNTSLCRALDLPYETPISVRATTVQTSVGIALRVNVARRDPRDDAATELGDFTVTTLRERRDEYVARLERFREAIRGVYSDNGASLSSHAVRRIRRHLASPEWAGTYARAVLRQAGMDVDARPTNDVIDLVNASFTFDTQILDLAILQSYNLRRHASDWFDSNQLANLANPNTTFVTAERRIYDWTRGSSQAARVIRASDCLR
jgi:hypothetical protein